MTFETFRQTLCNAAPPAELGPAMIALWWAGKGNWHQAHETVQAHEEDRICAWVHAHLHREEGDLANAGYWYSIAGRPVCHDPLPQEWESLVTTLLV